MLLITAAHGNQGRLLVPKLLAQGVTLRACVRSEASADVLRASGVSEVIVGDLAEPAIARQAVAGADGIYHVGPTADPHEREMGLQLVTIAREENVRFFVLSSVLHAIVTDLIQHEIKRDIEEALICSGLAYTILQPTNYMAPWRLQPVFTEGVFRLSWSLDRRQSLIDLEDVTDVAVMALTDPQRHNGATYELVGEGRFTAHELAAIAADVIGRPVAAEQYTPEDYVATFLADRDPSDHATEVMKAISKHYSTHDFVGNPNVLRWLLGRAPNTVEQFVRREYQRYLDQT